MKFLLGTFLFILVSGIAAEAQQPIPTSQPWTKQDSAAINALVLYPDSIRLAIFEACEYPGVIVNVADLQKNSSTDFSNLVSSYPQSAQEAIWNMSRYPGLISKLAEGGQKSPDQINGIVADYPADIHDVALTYGQNNYDLLKKIDDLQNQTNAEFEGLISIYPPQVQAAFRQLIQLPEALSLLNDNLNLTVRVGEHYKTDPQRVIAKADSLNLVQARQNAQDVQQWKQTIQTDTAAQSELKDAANEYAVGNGYTQNQVDEPIDDTNNVSNYTCYPYPYWFGYPSWYPYSYWYPYPYWYDWGFYYGPGGGLVVFGMPGFYFTNWFFYHPEHWNRYPHLGNVYVNHYYSRNRNVFTSNDLIVHNWIHNNRAYLPADFKTNPAHRVEAIREVGQLNEEVQKQVGARNPVTAAARNAYLQNNSDRYPVLNKTPQQPKLTETRQMPNIMQQPVRQPAVAPRQQAQQQQHSNFAPRSSSPYNYNNVNRAQQYHQNVWQQSQPAQRAQPEYHAQPQMEAPRSAPSAPSPRTR